MSDNVTPSSLIFHIRKAARQKQVITDSSPRLWTPTEQLNDRDRDRDGSDDCCQVCHTNKSRYKCPKCLVAYCSSACYRNHSEGSNACSERFYQDRVAGVLKTEAKENQAAIHQVLRRADQNRRDGIDDDDGNCVPPLSQDELYNLLELIENGDEREFEKLFRDRPDLKAELETSMQLGELTDWVLEPWDPWWRHTFSSGVLKEEEERNEGLGLTIETDEQFLDERLLQIPCFSLLRSRQNEIPRQLRFNLIEIIFSIVTTLRQYHGHRNALEVSIDATESIVTFSRVLSCDFRFDSVPHALITISETFTDQQSTFKGKLVLKALLEDVAFVIRNRRLIGRALLEAKDILSFSVDMRRKIPEDKTERTSPVKMALRKLEFYLSYSQDVSISIDRDGLSGEILTWTNEWVQPHCPEITAVSEIQLPGLTANESRPKQSTSSNHLLIKEISSNRRGV